jgi:hypothetical protein
MSKPSFIFEQPLEVSNDIDSCDLLTLAPELGQIKVIHHKCIVEILHSMIDNPPRCRPNIPKLIKKLNVLVVSVSEVDTADLCLNISSQGRLRNRDNDLFSSPFARKRPNHRPSSIGTHMNIDSSFDCSYEPMAINSRSLIDNNGINDDDISTITKGMHVLCSPLKAKPLNTLVTSSMSLDNGKLYYIHLFFHL